MASLGMASLIIGIVTTIIMIPLNALLLMISTKIFKIKDTSYMTALKVAAILGVVSIVLSVIGNFLPTVGQIIFWLSMIIVSIVLALWLIKSMYSLDWGKAALVWLVWFVLSLIVGFIFALIIAAIVVLVGFGGLALAATAG
jgi:hypothetical protein